MTAGLKALAQVLPLAVNPVVPEPGNPKDRHTWIRDYHGKATVIHGHTPVRELRWHRETIDIDTGCVFGGELTALRWPERELVSVLCKHCFNRGTRVYRPLGLPLFRLSDHLQPADYAEVEAEVAAVPASELSHWSPDGLPVGVQLVARRQRDLAVLGDEADAGPGRSA